MHICDTECPHWDFVIKQHKLKPYMYLQLVTICSLIVISAFIKVKNKSKNSETLKKQPATWNGQTVEVSLNTETLKYTSINALRNSNLWNYSFQQTNIQIPLKLIPFVFKAPVDVFYCFPDHAIEICVQFVYPCSLTFWACTHKFTKSYYTVLTQTSHIMETISEKNDCNLAFANDWTLIEW